MSYLYLCIAIVCNALANICLKLGAKQFHQGLSKIFEEPAVLFKNGYLVAGISLFVVALVLYTMVLARTNLSVAYPMMVSIGFTIVLTYSVVFLHERLWWWQWMGIALILIGVMLISLNEV